MVVLCWVCLYWVLVVVVYILDCWLFCYRYWFWFFVGVFCLWFVWLCVKLLDVLVCRDVWCDCLYDWLWVGIGWDCWFWCWKNCIVLWGCWLWWLCLGFWLLCWFLFFCWRWCFFCVIWCGIFLIWCLCVVIFLSCWLLDIWVLYICVCLFVGLCEVGFWKFFCVLGKIGWCEIWEMDWIFLEIDLDCLLLVYCCLDLVCGLLLVLLEKFLWLFYMLCIVLFLRVCDCWLDREILFGKVLYLMLSFFVLMWFCLFFWCLCVKLCLCCWELLLVVCLCWVIVVWIFFFVVGYFCIGRVFVWWDLGLLCFCSYWWVFSCCCECVLLDCVC